MSRAVLAVPVIALVTLALGLAGCLAGLVDPSGDWPHRLNRIWSRMILSLLGVRVLVSGAENLPAGPALYAANHGSVLDIPILFGHLPVAFRIIHKRSLYLIPVVGTYLFLAGHIGIDRSKPFRARRSLARAAERIRGGTSVVVFPEGTRSPDPSVQPFKKGSFLLALNAGVPVVPVSLAGVKRLIPRGIRTLRPGTIQLRIHPLVPTVGRPPESAPALAVDVRQAVVAGCQE